MTKYRAPQSLVDADMARLREASERAKATRRTTPETLSAPFKPVNMDVSKVSDHWQRERAEYGKKGPRWASPLYAKAMSKVTERAPDFHHKASHVLRDEGFSQPATAQVLGISDRMVRQYLAEPCPALQMERYEIAWRDRVVHHERTKRGKAPFDVWAYLREAEPPFVAELLGFNPWGKEDAGSTTKERIAFFLMDGDWTIQEITNLVGVDRSTVSRHARIMREKVSIKVRRAAAFHKRRNNRSTMLT